MCLLYVVVAVAITMIIVLPLGVSIGIKYITDKYLAEKSAVGPERPRYHPSTHDVRETNIPRENNTNTRGHIGPQSGILRTEKTSFPERPRRSASVGKVVDVDTNSHPTESRFPEHRSNTRDTFGPTDSKNQRYQQIPPRSEQRSTRTGSHQQISHEAHLHESRIGRGEVYVRVEQPSENPSELSTIHYNNGGYDSYPIGYSGSTATDSTPVSKKKLRKPNQMV
jgi:hypothetical protein